MILQYDKMQQYVDLIAELPLAEGYTTGELEEPFRLYKDAKISIHYVPFDYINPHAKVAFVGVTPGWQQMEEAIREYRRCLELGMSQAEIAVSVDNTASFAGTMRKNMVEMLDDLGLNNYLGIDSTGSLFAADSHLVHTTFAIRYAVFTKRCDDCSGSIPAILKHETLKEYIENTLAPELRQVPDALVIALGNAPGEALEYLVSKGKIESQRCLVGFPNPSGGNGWRVRHYNERKEELSKAIQVWFNQ